MGYETKLLIGRSTNLTEDEYAKGEPELDGDVVYHPNLKDDKGGLIKTGKKKTWFQIMATIDLCKCGYESHIHKIEHMNRDENHFWYWYSGNDEQTEDCYGDKLKPISVTKVIKALKEDMQNSDYRRFKWALALLESMKNDPEGITVLFYGH